MDRLRIVESCLPQPSEEISKSPKIVESPLPGSVIVRHPQPPPPPPPEATDDGVHSEPEVVILSHPPATSQPIAKVAVRSDLTGPVDGPLSSEVRSGPRPFYQSWDQFRFGCFNLFFFLNGWKRIPEARNFQSLVCLST